MSTRSLHGVIEDGVYYFNYIHWDGYPEWMIEQVAKQCSPDNLYSTMRNIHQLPYISSMYAKNGTPLFSFKNFEKNEDNEVAATDIKSVAEFGMEYYGVEFIYIYEKVVDDTGKFVGTRVRCYDCNSDKEIQPVVIDFEMAQKRIKERLKS